MGYRTVFSTPIALSHMGRKSNGSLGRNLITVNKRLSRLNFELIITGDGHVDDIEEMPVTDSERESRSFSAPYSVASRSMSFFNYLYSSTLGKSQSDDPRSNSITFDLR